MGSTYIDPAVEIAWWLEGDQLGLVRVSATGNIPAAINENIANGLLLHCEVEPESRTEPNEFPDIDNVFHAPLVDIVLSKLYRKAASDFTRRGRVEEAQMNRAFARDHQKMYDEKVKRLGIKKTDKTGGKRAIRPLNFT